MRVRKDQATMMRLEPATRLEPGWNQVGTRDILPTGNVIMRVNAREMRDVPEDELLDVINGLVSWEIGGSVL